MSKKPHKQRLFILLSYTHSHHVYLNILVTGTSRRTWPLYLTIRETHFANSWKIEFCSARRTNLDKLFLRVAAIKLNLQDDEVQPTFYSIFLIILVIIALHLLHGIFSLCCNIPFFIMCISSLAVLFFVLFICGPLSMCELV